MSIPSRSFYIESEGESIFASLYEAQGPARDTAVLLCPPFGWEDMCSYRARREWASLLAGAGFAALRIDLPGSGDSTGGPRDPERLSAWTDALDASARWLAQTSGARRTVALGIGLGGAIAYRAFALGEAIDDLVLWGVSSRGRRHVRELRAFSYLESPRAAESTTATVEDAGDGSLVVAGYLISAETKRELEELDLAELASPRLASARVLLLERDGQAVDARLREAIERGGAELTVSAGDGYAAMMMAELPHAVSADGVFDTVSSWLAQTPAGTAGGSRPGSGPASPGASGPLHTSVAEISMPDGTRVRETPIVISHRLGDPVGILAEPLEAARDLCAVWLNAGPQRRIGPNRMWVEAARRWAALGVPTLRVDLAAIGDADGDSRALLEVRSYYTDEYLDQVRLVLDTLQARGLGPRFLLGGLCAGAYWSLRMAQEDSRVSAAAVLNPGYLVYDGGLSNAIGQSRALIPRLFKRSTWRRVLRGEFRPASHIHSMRTILKALGRAVLSLPSRALPRNARSDENEITRAFDQLRAREQRALILFAGEERLYAQLLASGRLSGLERWPNIAVEHIAVAGDMHTLRPLKLQREAHQLIDELLQRELELIAE